MGNWKTVNLIGAMTSEDAAKLREYLGYNLFDRDDPAMNRFGPLSFSRDQPSMCGLNAWPAAEMNCEGNLAERNFDVEDVAEHLRELVTVAPSMWLKVHCGDDYEALDCVATISVSEGLVVVGKPEVEQLQPLDDRMMFANLMEALILPRRV